MRACQPKDAKRREWGSARAHRGDREKQTDSGRTWERERDAWPFGSCFYSFFPPPGPALCKPGQPGALLVLPEVLTPVLGPSFVLFSWAFPFLVFWLPPFWTPVSYSNYLTVVSLSFNPWFLFCSSVSVVLENEDWDSGNRSSVCVRDTRGSLGGRMREGAAPGSSLQARFFLPGSLSLQSHSTLAAAIRFCFLPL